MTTPRTIDEPGHCDHCGRDLKTVSYGRTADGMRVCHPMIPDGPDCYRLVTVHNETVGTRKRKLIPRERGDLLQRIAELKAELIEMTEARDSALRQLNREDVSVPLDLEDLVQQGLDAVISDWEGDVSQDRVIESIVRMLHPSVVELVEYRERAEAKIRELAQKVALLESQVSYTKEHHQRRTETLEAARDRNKKLLDDVVNEVFTVTSAYALPEDRDEASNAHLYALGRSAALQDAHYAVLRGLGCFDPNHEVWIPLSRVEDVDLIRLAINDPGAFTEREKINDIGGYESLGQWGARAVLIALREGRRDR